MYLETEEGIFNLALFQRIFLDYLDEATATLVGIDNRGVPQHLLGPTTIEAAEYLYSLLAERLARQGSWAGQSVNGISTVQEGE